jgi:hypothetical protein
MSAANIQPPTTDDINRIAALRDPVLRNLQITQAYHELAVELAHWLPGGANWCAFAVWASRQAGQSIRRQDLQRTLERLLRDSQEARQAAAALEAEGARIRGDETESLAGAVAALRDALNPATAIERVAHAVARGNQKVFVEIGLEFARFLALFTGRVPYEGEVADFCEGLRPGGSPDDQRYLRRAFTHYHQALTSDQDKARAELILLANLEIGFHEQTRLQPEIREAMDAPFYEPSALRRRLLEELFPDPSSQLRLAAARLAGQADPLLAARDRLAHEAQRLGRLAITEVMMTLELSGGRVLRLGEALRVNFPPPLQTLENNDLLGLLKPLGSSTAAPSDWSRLPERMHFIAGLFRAYQTDAGLFAPPFSVEQAAAVKAGRRPPDM